MRGLLLCVRNLSAFSSCSWSNEFLRRLWRLFFEVILLSDEGSQLWDGVDQIETEGSPHVNGWAVFSLLSVKQLEIVFSIEFRDILRLAYWVHNNFEQVIKHFRDQVLHERARSSVERVCVALDQPNAEVLVKKEVKAEQLEHILP